MAAYFAALRIIELKRKRNHLCTKLMKDLQNPFNFDENTFKNRFCLNQDGVMYLMELIRPIMKKNQGYPIELQAIITFFKLFILFSLLLRNILFTSYIFLVVL